MIFRLVGTYSLLVSLVGVGIFLYSFFPSGGREIFLLALPTCLIGFVVSIFGLVYDKNKRFSVISLILCLIPWIAFAVVFLFGKH